MIQYSSTVEIMIRYADKLKEGDILGRISLGWYLSKPHKWTAGYIMNVINKGRIKYGSLYWRRVPDRGIAEILYITMKEQLNKNIYFTL